MLNKSEENITSFIEMNNLSAIVADHVPAMLAYWDRDQICQYANPAYLAWVGKNREDMIGKVNMLEILGSDIYEKNLPFIKAVLNGDAQHFEREIRIETGEIRNTIVNYYPAIFEGKVKGFSVHLVDITNSKSLEKVISIAENKFIGLVESAPDATIIIDNLGEIQLINAQVEKLFGYTSLELVNKTFFKLLADLDTAKTVASWTAFINNKESKKNIALVELKGLKKNGEIFPIEINVSKIQTEDVFHICASIRDVAQRHKLELQLKKQSDLNRIFIAQSTHAIAMLDLHMCYLAVSERWMTDYQLIGNEIVGRSHYEVFPEIGEDWKAVYANCLKGEISKCEEASLVRLDGTVQWITWEIKPWYIVDGTIGGILIFTADITALKEKEQEKQRIEEILDRTNEVARIGTWEVDLIQHKVTWSRITREIHEVDLDFEPQLETGIQFYKEGSSREIISRAVEAAIESGINFDVEVELVTAKGNLLWTRSIGQVELKNGKCVRLYGVFQDIDQTKRTEEALHLSNVELNTIFDAGYVSIIGTDIDGQITHFNKGAERLLQYSREEMIGHKTVQLLHLNEEIIKRGVELSEQFGKNIAGFDVFLQMAKIEDFEIREWTYVRKDGTYFPVQLVVTAIKNSIGEIVGFLGVGTDISALKNAENELKSVLDITTDQNERLKNFAYIVSHNLRSHTGNLDMVVDLYIQENEGVGNNEYIKLLNSALKNLKETIANLNEVVLINTSNDHLVPINLFNLIDTAAKSVSQIANSASVKIINQVDVKTNMLGIYAYAESIILNFITNGIKYRSLDRPANVTFSTTTTSEYLILIIADNGIGIDMKKNRSKIFGMYKTFNGNEDARGIGLYISKNQIEAMGGKVEVESELDKGTIFKIYLKYEKN